MTNIEGKIFNKLKLFLLLAAFISYKYIAFKVLGYNKFIELEVLP